MGGLRDVADGREAARHWKRRAGRRLRGCRGDGRVERDELDSVAQLGRQGAGNRGEESTEEAAGRWESQEGDQGWLMCRRIGGLLEGCGESGGSGGREWERKSAKKWAGSSGK